LEVEEFETACEETRFGYCGGDECPVRGRHVRDELGAKVGMFSN